MVCKQGPFIQILTVFQFEQVIIESSFISQFFLSLRHFKFCFKSHFITFTFFQIEAEQSQKRLTNSYLNARLIIEERKNIFWSLKALFKSC
jgi:hypothetical protein